MGRGQVMAFGQMAGGGQRGRAVHAQVNVHNRKGIRKIAETQETRRGR